MELALHSQRVKAMEVVHRTTNGSGRRSRHGGDDPFFMHSSSNPPANVQQASALTVVLSQRPFMDSPAPSGEVLFKCTHLHSENGVSSTLSAGENRARLGNRYRLEHPARDMLIAARSDKQDNVSLVTIRHCQISAQASLSHISLSEDGVYSTHSAGEIQRLLCLGRTCDRCGTDHHLHTQGEHQDFDTEPKFRLCAVQDVCVGMLRHTFLVMLEGVCCCPNLHAKTSEGRGCWQGGIEARIGDVIRIG